MDVVNTPESPEVIWEEHFDDRPTGVEAEQVAPLDEASRELRKPWNPDDIRVSTKSFSLRYVLDMIEAKDLDLAPDFQRNRVWKDSQKSRLVESVLLQIPLPTFYFAEDADGMLRVVDGLQRLSTIRDFVRGGDNSLVLRHLEYLDECENQRFSQLSPALQRRINSTQIVVHVIDPTTPRRVKFGIFRRINTGGTPLNSQEIRHCMSNPRSREFLKRCTHTPEFDQVTGGRFRDHIRMDDREVVLRFCAFQLLGVEGYAKAGSMDVFLDQANEFIDDPQRVPDSRLDLLHESFRSAMAKAFEVFGEHAFRKWYVDQKGRNPINRPLFETWSYVLAGYEMDDLIERKKAIVAAARNMMTYDAEYVESITTSTGDIRKVRRRFDMAGAAASATEF